MKGSQAKEVLVRLAVVDTDPLRFVGFRTLLSSESDFDLQSVPLTEIETYREVDIILLDTHRVRSLLEVLSTLRSVRPALDVIVTGCDLNDTTILKAIAAGAKGCVDESASFGELVRAIRTVRGGSVWA